MNSNPQAMQHRFVYFKRPVSHIFEYEITIMANTHVYFPDSSYILIPLDCLCV